MSSLKIYSSICLLAASSSLAAWTGKAEKPSCNEEAITAYGIYACEISTPEQLAGLAEQLDTLAEVPTITLTLASDLVFGEDSISVSETAWKPIANFNGVFYGNGHTISGLNITSESGVLGLFKSFNGTARDLTIAHSTLNYKSEFSNQHDYFYAGFFAGSAKADLINIHSVENALHFEDSSATIFRRAHLGGLVGDLTGSTDSCSNSSEIVAKIYDIDAYIGGIVGESKKNSNSINSGNISVSGNTEMQDVYVGGIAGEDSLAANSKNSGTITAKAKRVGGIVGYGSASDFCENTGSITNTHKIQEWDTSFVGGIIGTGKAQYSINKGSVKGGIAGGLAGKGGGTQNINEGSVTGSLYAGGIGGDCGSVVASINRGSIDGGNVGGLCGRNFTIVGSSISYTENANGSESTGGIIAINYGQVIGAFYDTTKVPGIQPIAKDSADMINWEMRGMSTKDMQTVEFASKLNDIVKNGTPFVGHSFDGFYFTPYLWTTNGSYPFFADSDNLPIQKILLDDSLYVKKAYTDSKGHLQDIPLAVSKEGRYFQGWVDSVGTPVTKTTVFTDSQTIFAKYSNTITDSSLVIFNDNPTEKTPVIGWNGEFEEPVLKMHKDSSLYQVISTPGEYAWYIMNTRYRTSGENPYIDRAVLANDIYLAKDTAKYLPENYMTGYLHKNNVFDGAGHSIYGLNGRMFRDVGKGAVIRNVNLVNLFMNPSSGYNTDKASAFAYDNEGTIQNSSIRNAIVDSTAKVIYGFVVNNKKEGVIENCENYSNFTEETKYVQSITGFVGYNEGLIKNITNYGNISHPYDSNIEDLSYTQPVYIAGIVQSNTGVIEKAINKGNIFGESARESTVYVQSIQIAGIANSGGTIKNSRNEGNITFNYTKSELDVRIGGISSGKATIDSSANLGSIKVDIADSIAKKNSLVIGGIALEGSVKNSTNEGNISAIDTTSARWVHVRFAGILSGGIYGLEGIDVDSCTNKGDIEGFIVVAGILGQGAGNIQNVRNFGNIKAHRGPTYSSKETYVGGIAGLSSQDNGINHAFNEGEVTAVATEKDSTTSYVGGICGFADHTDLNVVSNTASVSASGKNAYAGGIVGYAKYNNFINVYNWGEIQSDSAAGGIVGRKYSYNNYYENVYNAAPVKGAYVGPIEPVEYYEYRKFKDTTTSIFYDSSFVRDTADKVSMYSARVAITPMSTETMKSDDFVVVLNTSNHEKENSGIWTRDGGYPIFNEKPTPVVASSSSQEESSSSVPASSSSGDQGKSSSSKKVDSSSSQAKSSSSAISSSSSKSKDKSSSSAKSSSSKGKDFVLQHNTDFNFSLEVSGRTILLSNVQEYASYALFDMQGKTVSAGALQKGYMQIAVPRAGTYLIRVGKKLQKVIVE
ncbi:MAG: hypothetical protein IKP03_10340 [Fibrobacter sp.]|nr:hypothetical protein [Fibrobacter sp.]